MPKILKQKGATAWVDGDNALGVVVGNFCTDLAAKMAQEQGIGWVVAKNSNHYGIAAYYPLRMSQKYDLVVRAFFTLFLCYIFRVCLSQIPHLWYSQIVHPKLVLEQIL